MKTAYFNKFSLDLPDNCVRECSRSGAADEAVGFWQSKNNRPAECTPEALADELREHGAWDDEELADDAANWRRIIWIAACNIREEQAD